MPKLDHSEKIFFYFYGFVRWKFPQNLLINTYSKMIKPIEYIGPVPKKRKNKPRIGGWVILFLASLFIVKFAWPYIEGVAHASQDQPNNELANEVSNRFTNSLIPAQRVAGEAIRNTTLDISHDTNYYKIAYPMGDIPPDKGKNTDIVIRALRAGGLDLQQVIHEDMTENYNSYPQLWQLKEPDPSIDHRRIENINRFLTRHHISGDVSRKRSSYNIGNIVVWQLPQGQLHLGIVVPGPGIHSNEKWVVHHLNDRPLWADSLLDYHVLGNYTIDVKKLSLAQD